MRNKDEDLTDTTCYKMEKEEKVSMHMHDTLKTNCEEKKSRKKEEKKTWDSNPHPRK